MERKEIIYDAAWKLYCQFGLQKVNIQEIADKAGVSKKTIYNHFNGKEDLFCRTIEWHVLKIVNFYETLIREDTDDLTGKLIRAIDYASEVMRIKNSKVYRDMDRHNPYLRVPPRIYIQTNVKDAICSLIDQARTEGLCKSDQSTEVLSLILFSLINGLFTWGEEERLPVPFSDLFNAAINLFLESLLTDEGKNLLKNYREKNQI